MDWNVGDEFVIIDNIEDGLMHLATKGVVYKVLLTEPPLDYRYEGRYVNGRSAVASGNKNIIWFEADNSNHILYISKKNIERASKLHKVLI